MGAVIFGVDIGNDTGATPAGSPAVSLIVLAIPFRIADRSIWTIFYAPLPGFSAIRDPKRVIEVYELAAVLVTALLLTKAPPTSAGLRLAIVALTLRAARDRLESSHNGWISTTSSVTTYRRWVEAPINPDPSCRSFFIKGASEMYHVSVVSQVGPLRDGLDVHLARVFNPDAERL